MRFHCTINTQALDFLEFEGIRKAQFREWAKLHNGAKIVIEEVKNKRSLRANAYYWACLEIIANDTGNSSEDMHRYFKGQYLPRKFIKVKNKEVQLTGSTSELTTTQFMEYFERVQVEAAQLGIVLPNPQQYKDFYDTAPSK